MGAGETDVIPLGSSVVWDLSRQSGEWDVIVHLIEITLINGCARAYGSDEAQVN
jgi:hypothetical protein